MYEQSDQLNNSSTADTTAAATTTAAAAVSAISTAITDNNNDNNGNLNLNSNNSMIGVCSEGKNFNNEHLNLNLSFNNCCNDDNHTSFTNIIDVVDNNIELSTAATITSITAINNKDKDNCDAIVSIITTPSTVSTEMTTTTQSTLIQQKMPELMLSPSSSSSSSSPSKTVESESQTDITVTNDCDGQSIIGGSNNAVVAAVAPTAITTNSNDCLTKQNDISNGNENESKNSTATAIAATNNTTIVATTTTTSVDKIDGAIRNNNKMVVALNANVTDTLKKESNELKLNKLNDTFTIISENSNCNENYIDEPEISLIEIKERMIDLENPDNEKTADSESEEDDQLKPLMTFNHPSVIDNQEYCTYHGHAHHQCMDHFENVSKDVFNSADCRTSSLHNNNENLKGHNDMKNSDCKDMQKIPEIKEIDTLPASEIPNDQLCADIVEQVEFYFSNDSILRDAFLLKHVRRNKEGFVSLKLISSFKRVRQFTKDWRVVGHAIRRKSKKIELNDLATKIRRLEPLPSFDETMPSRTIVACDLPFEKLCIEKVSDIFSKCGEIALIRILRPGMGIPVDVRQFMNKYPEMQQKECALVEFVESQSARNALNLNDNFKVYEMIAPRKKTGKKSTSVTKMIENYKFIDHNYERSRGGGAGTGSFNASMDNNYKYNNAPRRSFSEYYVRLDQQQPQQQQHQHYQYQQQTQHQLQQSMPHVYAPRKYSFSDNNNKNNNMNSNIVNNNSNNNNNSNSNIANITNNEMMNFGPYSPRRISTCSMGSSDHSRKYSSCSEGYSSCSELSRRTSTCSSDQSRRTSNCSDYCPCSRRSSQCSDIYRRMSQYSEHNHVINTNNNNINNNNNNNNNNARKFSSGSGIYPNSQNMRRRISMDSNYERKISTGSIGSNSGNNNNDGIQIMYDQYRKFSNNSNSFDPNHKLSDPYYNDRRISIDSGYDRKLSFSSDYSSSPRSRSNSFLMCHQHKNIENVVRTPIGPDGSKGFTQRTRKLGQIVSPV